MGNEAPFIFTMLSKYFWVLFIGGTVINAFYLKYHSKKYIEKNPELAEGYEKLFKGILFWTNIPLVIMGIGCTIGNIPSVFYFLNPGSDNPYVIAWFVSIIGLWILGTNWIFFQNGAEFLSEHKGLIGANIGVTRTEKINPTTIKILWLVAIAGGILALIYLWNNPVNKYFLLSLM